MFTPAEAEVPDMSGGAAGSAARQAERSWAGLGAITALVFTVIAYATAAGMVLLGGALHAAATGRIESGRWILSAILLAPSVYVVRSLRRRSG